jgi:acetyl-CoA carboxylase carboxyltransferase component
MCGKAYDPRLIFAWPTASLAVMGGKQASETLLSIRLQQVAKGGAEVSADARKKLLAEVQSRYEKEADPYFAAARLWVDGIIDPAETRAIVSRGISVASHQSEIPSFSPGVIQT